MHAAICLSPKRPAKDLNSNSSQPKPLDQPRGFASPGVAVYLNIELIGLAESAFSSVLNQLGQFLPRVEHAGLHGGGGDAEDCRALLDRLLVIVNEVDDFPMFQG